MIIFGANNNLDRNEIFVDDNLGIDINNDGRTPNDDTNDMDGVQNFPYISPFVIDFADEKLQFGIILNSTKPKKTYRINVYVALKNQNGYFEGAAPFAVFPVTTDANGDFHSGATTLLGLDYVFQQQTFQLQTDDFLVATATESGSGLSTSEFSDPAGLCGDSTMAAGGPFDATALQHQVEQLRHQWNVPGVALAIVRDGDVVFIEGFGVRDIEKESPFTPDTLIRAASTTKSFTAALVGQLVDESVVEWDRPVREYHPDFQMVDTFATAEMTLEDMMCHRSGLPYHENLLVAGVGRDLTGSPRGFRENLIRRLRFFEPSHAFRTHFQYQDVVFTAAFAHRRSISLPLNAPVEIEMMVEVRA